MAWGLATAGHRDEPLFRRLLAKCCRQVASSDVQGLANTMWAAGALGVRDDAFMAAAAGECCRRADELSPQQVGGGGRASARGCARFELLAWVGAPVCAAQSTGAGMLHN